jgi:hypothetical protein
MIILGVIGAVFLLRFVLIIAIPLVIVAAYMAPSIVAYRRHVINRGSVLVINLLLGWTLIGWAVALAMACRTAPPRPMPQLPVEEAVASDAANRFAWAYRQWELADPAFRGPRPELEQFVPPAISVISVNDANYLRMIAGTQYAPGQLIALPSGRTITGAQMARWLAENRGSGREAR